MTELKLTGPRGDNPLGFLATLGTMAALEDAGVEAELRWEGLSPWIRFHVNSPVNASISVQPGQTANHSGERQCIIGHAKLSKEAHALVDLLLTTLQRDPVSEEKQRMVNETRKEMENLATKIRKKETEIRKRKLGRQEREAAMQSEVSPLLAEQSRARKAFVAALQQSGIDPVLTLGKNLSASSAEFMNFLSWLITSAAPDFGLFCRTLNLAASFGLCDPNKPEDNIQPSPWALITGAGHQHFLETVSELMQVCTACHLAQALFGPWIPSDPRLSLRLDPVDDRRYALMASDPTSTGNKAMTLWGANRLAFEALRFFTAYPSTRNGCAFVGWWPSSKGGFRSDPEARWPLWHAWLTAPEIHSVLALPEIWSYRRNDRFNVRNRSVFAVIRTMRIQVDKYFNLLPGTPVWMS